jgi:oligopeptide/dipeptide ABC transporter ATP-binding protein
VTALLRVENLRTWFDSDRGPIRAVDGVDFEIESGRTLGVVGESGSGKSVTALSVMRLVDDPGHIADESKIVFDGRDLTSLDEGEMEHVRGDEISMIFQEPMTSLNPVYTVGDQIAEAVRSHESVGASEAATRAVDMLELVGIPEAARRARDYPHQLSGGMRQRVMIGIALACNPKLLIADEPTTALDVTIQAQILELMKRLKRDYSSSILLITHDMGVVSELADRIIVMYAGGAVEEGPKSAVFRDPQHPYTWGLLDAIPRVDRPRVQRLVAIPGAPPSLLSPPEGCRFEPRCAYRFDRCSIRPELAERVAPGRRDACHLDPSVRPALRRKSA